MPPWRGSRARAGRFRGWWVMERSVGRSFFIGWEEVLGPIKLGQHCCSATSILRVYSKKSSVKSSNGCGSKQGYLG